MAHTGCPECSAPKGNQCSEQRGFSLDVDSIEELILELLRNRYESESVTTSLRSEKGPPFDSEAALGCSRHQKLKSNKIGSTSQSFQGALLSASEKFIFFMKHHLKYSMLLAEAPHTMLSNTSSASASAKTSSCGKEGGEDHSYLTHC